MSDPVLTAADIREMARDRKRRTKRREILVQFVTAIVKGAVFATMNGWYLMLAVGIARHEWIRALPTIGYGWALLLAFLLHGLFMPVPATKKKESTR
jgi:hypothetical protein